MKKVHSRMIRHCIKVLSLSFLASCSEVEEPNKATPFFLNYPGNFPIMETSENNPLTVEGIELGRFLYYDTKLSANGPEQGNACASCHTQSKSFSNNTVGTSVLPHINLGWSSRFLWNGKIEGSLEDIMLFEINEFFQTDLSAIAADAAYQNRFLKAFGSDEVTEQKAAFAMAQFLRTVVSYQSKFDLFMRKEGKLNEAEYRGFSIFNSEKGDCFHCHSLPLLSDNSFHNNGLDSIFTEKNQGLAAVTKIRSDVGLYKTPTLRNIALTAPYMHDGRFANLKEVIEFYNSGVLHSATLDPIMTKAQKTKGLQLSESEKADLLAFLNACTDYEFLQNPSISNPK